MPLVLSTMFWALFIAMLVKIILSRNHLLLILLTLESMTLCVFTGLIISCTQIHWNMLIFFTFIALAVCEASVGLCLLIRVSRQSGNELIPHLPFKLIKLKTFKVFNAHQLT